MTDTTDEQPPEPTAALDEAQRPLRQRVADRWNGLNVAGKAVVVGGVVLTVAGGLVLLAKARASVDGPERDGSDHAGDGDETTGRQDYRYWTNHAGGYYVCRHQGCSKKRNRSITGHDCCGRCETSRIRKCSEVAERSYDGPGSFLHDYREGMLFPGVCVTCGRPPEGHWVLDGAETRLR